MASLLVTVKFGATAAHREYLIRFKGDPELPCPVPIPKRQKSVLFDVAERIAKIQTRPDFSVREYIRYQPGAKATGVPAL
jgi:hypothetical protein